MFSLEWSAFKDVVNAKNLNVQFIELSNKYLLVAMDGHFSVDTVVVKSDPKNSDQIDFEDNFKNLPLTNSQDIQQVALTFADNNLTPVNRAFSFSADANTTTVFDFKLDEAFLFKGINFISSNVNTGDYIKVELIDKDDVLGNGTDYVIRTPVEKAFVQTTTNGDPLLFEDISITELPSSNLYVRVHYTNSVLLNPVDVYINLILYRRSL